MTTANIPDEMTRGTWKSPQWKNLFRNAGIVLALYSCTEVYWERRQLKNILTYHRISLEEDAHVPRNHNTHVLSIVERSWPKSIAVVENQKFSNDSHDSNNVSYSAAGSWNNASADMKNQSSAQTHIPKKVNNSSITSNKNVTKRISSETWPKVTTGCGDNCQSQNHALFPWPKLPSEDHLTCENLLVQVLHDDPEHNAFPDITIQTSQDADECFFPGLNEELLSSAYRHPRVAFLGDSTLRILSRYLYALLEMDGIEEFPLLTLEEGVKKIRHTAAKLGINFSDRDAPLPSTIQEGIHMEFNGIGGSRGAAEVKLLEDAWNKTIAMKPDVLVVNMGMHWLHIYGFGKNPTSNQIIRWIQYEEWLQECVDNAVNNGIKLLIFKKTNLICEGDYFGKYEKGTNNYQSHDRETMRQCEQFIKKELQKANYSTSDAMISTYCKQGLMAGSGAEYLNKRLLRFVKNMTAIPNLHVSVLDDPSIQSCNYTTDGRHFSQLNLLRIRLLGNQIQSYFGNDGSKSLVTRSD